MSGGLGARATHDSTRRRPSPRWGMGGSSAPSPERVTATGEPCGRAPGLWARPPATARRREDRRTGRRLHAVGGEGVALADFAGVEAALEPADALRGGAVGEAFWNDAPLRLPLQAVVADRGGRAQRFL